MRINLKLFTTFSKIGNKNHDFMRVSEALIQFNCQTRDLLYSYYHIIRILIHQIGKLLKCYRTVSHMHFYVTIYL